MRQMRCQGPMPYGWHQIVAGDGTPYYLNAVHKRATWIDPRLEYLGCFRKKTERLGKLPYGWEVSMDDNGEIFYYNSNTQEITQTAPAGSDASECESKDPTSSTACNASAKIIRSNTAPSLPPDTDNDIACAPVFFFSPIEDKSIFAPHSSNSDSNTVTSASPRSEELRQRLLKGNATEVLRQKLQRSVSEELNERLSKAHASFKNQKTKLVGSSSMPNIQHPLAQFPTFDVEEWEDITLPHSPPEWCSIQMAGSPRASPFDSISNLPQLFVALSTKKIELQDVPRPRSTKPKTECPSQCISSKKLPRKSNSDIKPFTTPQALKTNETRGLKMNLATHVGNEFASNLPGLDGYDSNKTSSNTNPRSSLSKGSYTNVSSTGATSSPILQRLRSSAENLFTNTSKPSSQVAGRTLAKLYTTSAAGQMHAAV